MIRQKMTLRQRVNLTLLILASSTYLGLALMAPHANAQNTPHLSPILILVLIVTILGLFLLAWWLGFYAWLQLDRYMHQLPRGAKRMAFGQMATGVLLLVAGLVTSSLVNATIPFSPSNSALSNIIAQINYGIIVLFPFLGFLWLRNGTRHLAVSAQAAMTLQTKLLTVGPPVLLLAAFYISLAATNSAPTARALATSPAGIIVLPLSVLLTIASWALGLLAALNTERATYGGEGTGQARALVGLYNGILLTTGGFIILDALLSLGATRLSQLPTAVSLFLVYAFIAVITLGFWIVSKGASRLISDDSSLAKERN